MVRDVLKFNCFGDSFELNDETVEFLFCIISLDTDPYIPGPLGRIVYKWLTIEKKIQ
jgi:hypothetical protein